MVPTLVGRFQQTFGRAPTVIVRAPGRIEFIGNHTDYNGGAVRIEPLIQADGGSASHGWHEYSRITRGEKAPDQSPTGAVTES